MRALGRRDWPESIPGCLRLLASHTLTETLLKGSRLSGPVLSNAFKARAAQIFWRHSNPEFNFSIEGQEPWLGQSGYIRRAIDIHNHDSTALPFPLAEPGVLRLDGIEYLLHLRANCSIFNECVERLNGALNQHHHPHEKPTCACIRVLLLVFFHEQHARRIPHASFDWPQYFVTDAVQFVTGTSRNRR